MTRVRMLLIALAAGSAASCTAFDGGLIEPRDAGSRADADGGSAGSSLDAGADAAPDSAVGSAPPRACEANPQMDPACPMLCPEECNSVDDDCDGRVDENGAALCALDNATGTCIGGACLLVECEAGFLDCDALITNGCEASLLTVEDCGACRNRCDAQLRHTAATTCTPLDVVASNGPTASCGVERCEPGFADCDGDDTTGCEADLQGADNCGGCASTGDNTPCAQLAGVAEGACAESRCTIVACAQGLVDCNREVADGCEWDSAQKGCCPDDPDTDGDGVFDCIDACQNDPTKSAPGVCGCGVPDVDLDGDGVDDCVDPCPYASAPQVEGECPFGFSAANHDAESLGLASAPELVLDCGQVTLSTSSTAAIDLCGTRVTPQLRTQSGGPELWVLALRSLSIQAGSSLRLTGARPAVFTVLRDATIGGELNVGATAGSAGAGGNAACAQGAGTGGPGANDTGSDDGSAGGGGGGFGGPGRAGGNADGSAVGGGAGAARGAAELSPLLGGCPGGRGGKGWTDSSPNNNGLVGVVNGNATPGAGGGALQLSVAGVLHLTSTAVLAAPGGGGGVMGGEDGGAGGGSGGGLLLEGARVVIDAGAWTSANGGGGGAGQSTDYDWVDAMPSGASGADGAGASAVAAPGGAGVDGGGSGGQGATASEAGKDGSAGGPRRSRRGGAGGGGGGGVGRIRIHGIFDCQLEGNSSPAASLACP